MELPQGTLVYIESSDPLTRGDLVEYKQRIYFYRPNGNSCHLFDAVEKIKNINAKSYSPKKAIVKRLQIFFQPLGWESMSTIERKEFIKRCRECRFSKIEAQDFERSFPGKGAFITKWLEGKQEEDSFVAVLQNGYPLRDGIKSLLSKDNFRVFHATDRDKILFASHLLSPAANQLDGPTIDSKLQPITSYDSLSYDEKPKPELIEDYNASNSTTIANNPTLKQKIGTSSSISSNSDASVSNKSAIENMKHSLFKPSPNSESSMNLSDIIESIANIVKKKESASNFIFFIDHDNCPKTLLGMENNLLDNIIIVSFLAPHTLPSVHLKELQKLKYSNLFITYSKESVNNSVDIAISMAIVELHHRLNGIPEIKQHDTDFAIVTSDHFALEIQQQMLDRNRRVHVIDGNKENLSTWLYNHDLIEENIFSHQPSSLSENDKQVFESKPAVKELLKDTYEYLESLPNMETGEWVSTSTVMKNVRWNKEENNMGITTALRKFHSLHNLEFDDSTRKQALVRIIPQVHNFAVKISVKSQRFVQKEFIEFVKQLTSSIVLPSAADKEPDLIPEENLNFTEQCCKICVTSIYQARHVYQSLIDAFREKSKDHRVTLYSSLFSNFVDIKIESRNKRKL